MRKRADPLENGLARPRVASVLNASESEPEVQKILDPTLKDDPQLAKAVEVLQKKLRE